MNRRTFLKFLGIGTATVATAPQLLAEKPKYTMGVDTASGADYTAVKAIKSGVIESFPRAGTYKYVYLHPTSLPVQMGDVVYYKDDRRHGCLAFRRKKLIWRDGESPGCGIGTLTPGMYGFIQIDLLRVPNEYFKYLEYLQQKMQDQLGIDDLKLLQKVKHG